MARNDFPLSYEMTGELVSLFRQELQECNLPPGETVALMCDSRTNPHYPAAFMGAAQELGAHVFELRVPFFTSSTRRIVRAASDDVIPPRGPLEAMKAADLVIDMSTVGWLYTNVHNQILASGTRTLMVNNPPEVLRRLLPCKEIRERTRAGAAFLEKGTKLHLTSRAGTDLTFSKKGRKGIFQYGASDIPGRWDHWPSGQVACAPIEGSAEGVLVLDVGDIVLRVERYSSEPIRCEFKSGKMVGIKGGGIDGYLIREYMNTWGDEKAFIPAHIGWGCEHRAIWIEQALPGPGGGMDAESFYGNILFGMGANYFVGLGGANVTPAHIDFCMRNCSFSVDGVAVLKDGEIVVDELK